MQHKPHNLPALVNGIHVQAARWARLGHGHHIVAIAQARRCRLTHAAIEKNRRKIVKNLRQAQAGVRTLVQRGSDMQTNYYNYLLYCVCIYWVYGIYRYRSYA